MCFVETLFQVLDVNRGCGGGRHIRRREERGGGVKLAVSLCLSVRNRHIQGKTAAAAAAAAAAADERPQGHQLADAVPEEERRRVRHYTRGRI